MKKYRFIFIIFAVFSVTANAQWENKSNGIPEGCSNHSLATCGNYLFAGIEKSPNLAEVFISGNNGETWERSNLGYTAWSLASWGNTVYAGTINFVYRSSDYGKSWEKPNYITYYEPIPNDMAIAGNFLYAMGARRIMKMVLSGLEWTESLFYNTSDSITLKCLYARDNYVFAGAGASGGKSGSVLVSKDYGVSWAKKPLTNNDIRTLKMNNSKLFAGTYAFYNSEKNGLFTSVDYGQTWTLSSLNNMHVYDLAFYGNHVFAATSLGVYLSKDNGVTWKPDSVGLIGSHLVIANGYLFMGGGLPNNIFRRTLTDITNADRISIGNSLSVFPNPASSRITLSLNRENSYNPADIRIFDYQGSLVFSGVISSNRQVIDINKLDEGIFFIKVRSGNWSAVQKLRVIK